jgi:hypothetical protein
MLLGHLGASFVVWQASSSAFNGTTQNPVNSWAASWPVCPAPSVLTSTADAWVWSPWGGGALGTGTTMNVENAGSNKGRSLVKFTLPAVPGGCTLSAASFALKTGTAGTAGRSYRVYRSATAWTEAAVVWGNQPATTGGFVAVAPTTGIGGITTWDVTTLVQADYAGTNNGLIIKDSLETGNFTFSFYTREYGTPADRPSLTLTWA